MKTKFHLNRMSRCCLWFFSIAVIFFGSSSDTFGARLFSDVPPGHQYFEAISALEQRGIIRGFSDGSFRPDDLISRAATLKVILLSAGVEFTGVATKNPFPDVPKNEWFALIAKKGRDIGIVKGDGNGHFLPARNISRAEALAMLFRTNGDNPDTPSQKPFSDVPLNAWFAKYFASAKKTGLLKADPIAPQHLLSRAELSDMTYRFFRGDWNSSEMRGEASYYGDQFEGRSTANGESFSNGEFTAAHRTLPFGTRVRATDPDSLKSVVVRINDRGPYVDGRIIDLSKAAFEVLAPASRGVMPVLLEVISESTPLGPAADCTGEDTGLTIEEDYYSGIQLFHPIPDTYRENEIFVISGEVTEDPPPDIVSVFYGTKEKKRLFRGVTSGKIFSIPVFFPESGEFLFSVLAGESGHADAEYIYVRKPKCEQNREKETESPINLRSEIKEGETVFYWDDPQNNLFRLEFSQDGKKVEFFVYDKKKLAPPPEAFEHFTEGLATIRIWGSKSESGALDRTSGWKQGEEQKIFLGKRISRGENLIFDVSLTDQFEIGEKIIFSGTSDMPVSSTALIIDPDENILDSSLQISGDKFSGEFTPKILGSHMVEINRTDGITLFVGQSVPKGTLPLLPDFFDLDSKITDDTFTDDKIPETLLRYTNKERVVRQLSKVETDESLMSLAQYRADDMCDRGYFAHRDPDGKYAGDYRVLHNVQTYVSENIVKDMNMRRAFERLMRSPAHRGNIINSMHTRVGFGYCRSSEDPLVVNIVQIFGGEPFRTNATGSWREKILRDINDVREEDPIVPSATVESVSQQWAVRMAKKNFWGFQDGEDTLESSLRDAGIKEYARGMVLKLGSISDIENEFSKASVSLGGEDQENFLLDTDFTKMGVGIAQNDIWEIFVVILAIQ